MTISTKKFDELTRSELYEILQDEKIVAYTRIFKPGSYFDEASIGRVVVKKPERKYGYGYDIMNASIKAVQDCFNETTIHLSAQTYLKKFYNSLGFKEMGEEYLEDGIPHIGMFKK